VILAMATPLKFETAEPQDRSSTGEEARKRERCSSRVDWPVYPRLRHIVQGSERAQCGPRLAWSKTAENRRDVGRADPKTPGLNSRPYRPGGRRMTRGGVASRSVAACKLSAAS
jgi:hypothetical protein